jgi:hypothetical protein
MPTRLHAARSICSQSTPGAVSTRTAGRRWARGSDVTLPMAVSMARFSFGVDSAVAASSNSAGETRKGAVRTLSMLLGQPHAGRHRRRCAPRRRWRRGRRNMVSVLLTRWARPPQQPAPVPYPAAVEVRTHGSSGSCSGEHLLHGHDQHRGGADALQALQGLPEHVLAADHVHGDRSSRPSSGRTVGASVPGSSAAIWARADLGAHAS